MKRLLYYVWSGVFAAILAVIVAVLFISPFVLYFLAFVALMVLAFEFGDSWRELDSALDYASHRWTHRYVPSLESAEARGFWEGLNFAFIMIALVWGFLAIKRKYWPETELSLRPLLLSWKSAHVTRGIEPRIEEACAPRVKKPKNPEAQLTTFETLRLCIRTAMFIGWACYSGWLIHFFYVTRGSLLKACFVACGALFLLFVEDIGLPFALAILAGVTYFKYHGTDHWPFIASCVMAVILFYIDDKRDDLRKRLGLDVATPEAKKAGAG